MADGGAVALGRGDWIAVGLGAGEAALLPQADTASASVAMRTRVVIDVTW
jgi:hypothetical protein